MRASIIFDLTPLSTSSRFRGIGTYALDLARALAAMETEFDLRFLVGARGKYTLLPPEGLEQDAVIALCGGKDVESYQRYYMEKRTFLRRFLSRSGAALYHATDPKGTPHPPRVRTVVTAHDLIPTVLGPPYRWYPYAVSAFIDRQHYRHDHVIAISDWTAKDLVRVAGVDPRRITVVHHGVEHTRFSPWRGAAERQAKPYYFYVGGFDRRKQVPDLIRAFGRIAADVGEELLIAGRPSPSARSELETAAREAGVADRVVILGFVAENELVDLYRGATAHPLPTLYEGFGMTALEAMACGCPVVTLRESCVPEICGDAAAYSDGSVDGLAFALKRVALDRAYRADLVARGLERAATFTWRRAAEQTLDAYRRTLAIA